MERPQVIGRDIHLNGMKSPKERDISDFVILVFILQLGRNSLIWPNGYNKFLHIHVIHYIVPTLPLCSTFMQCCSLKVLIHILTEYWQIITISRGTKNVVD